ncbi:MAG: hypothetical protein K0R76_18 [Alphaproteobacteria bacterium]|jgi:hypothetical protein|nr:hypothetical protein [Alphaproteobacteria bacterium]MDF3033064.1 hypothetical protein [Alphaproteobacteria bacterium]
MKKNLKILVSSALVALTFPASFAIYGMEISSDDDMELKRYQKYSRDVAKK